ncbi:hypothetical protein FRC09_005765 [Ceratobasidium sp. 395]|nr:hypothetical protein FRC09_005765 [Ceratobasidium sp. 395]
MESEFLFESTEPASSSKVLPEPVPPADNDLPLVSSVPTGGSEPPTTPKNQAQDGLRSITKDVPLDAPATQAVGGPTTAPAALAKPAKTMPPTRLTRVAKAKASEASAPSTSKANAPKSAPTMTTTVTAKKVAKVSTTTTTATEKKTTKASTKKKAPVKKPVAQRRPTTLTFAMEGAILLDALEKAKAGLSVEKLAEGFANEDDESSSDE